MITYLKNLSFLLLGIFFITACDTEPLDEHTKLSQGEFRPQFSFTLNGQRRFTDDVTVKWVDNSKVEIIAKIRDQYSNYGLLEVKLVLSQVVAGNFPAAVSPDAPDMFSSLSLKLPNNLTYTTSNAPTTADVGSANITSINYGSKYIMGDFQYKVYVPLAAQAQNPPLEIKNGVFSYIDVN